MIEASPFDVRPFSSEALRSQLRELGSEDDAESLDKHLSKLEAWQIPSIYLGSSPIMPEQQRARNNLTVLKQGLLHRCARLVLGAASMVQHHNPHGLALLARGHLEGVAQLGYFADRLSSLSKGNITFDQFHEKLAFTLMGASHPLFKVAPKPLNVITCLEKADRHLHRLHTDLADKMLMDDYNWLSDFCHPNFLSSKTAFDLDFETGTMTFRHKAGLSERDIEPLNYLAIHTEIFEVFFQNIEELEVHYLQNQHPEG